MSHSLHRQRRERLLAAEPDAVFIVRGAGAKGSSANFIYLTGLDAPQGALLMSQSGVRIGVGRNHPGPDYVRGRWARQVLFLPVGDALSTLWGEQGSVTAERCDAASLEVDAILPLSELDEVLTRVMTAAGRLDVVRASVPTLSGEDDAEVRWIDRIRRRFFAADLRDATGGVHEMRRLKDATEVAAIVAAGAVVGEAMEALTAVLRPGRHEYELEAEIARVYRGHGAVHAFEPIVATGANALQLHYTANRSRLEAGQLVLIDTGAALDGYKADVSRTLPVDGRFTPRQREVYEVVLQAQRAAIAACRPGALLAEVHARAYEVLARAGLGGAFPHGTSHHLGLETHDVGDVHRPLAAGCVVTVEPGAYLTEEGFGIRIEDDVLVGEGEPRVLTEPIPRSVEAIEQMLATR